MAVKTYDAGVKEYRDMYWTPDYVPLDTDLLACFKCTGQPGVPREEVAAAVAAESSTGTWSTVWSELLTDLEYYKGRAYRIEDVPGDKESFYAFIAYPIDLFEEGSVVNVLTSLVGNVFGFKALRHLRLEDVRFPIAYIKTCGGPPAGIQLERDRLNKYGRPLLGATIKPKLGLSAKNYGRAVYECLRGGLDMTKDDENVNSQPFMRWRDRFEFVGEAIQKAHTLFPYTTLFRSECKIGRASCRERVYAPASSTRSRPPSASASLPLPSSATTSACAARCCRPRCTELPTQGRLEHTGADPWSAPV